MTLPAFKKEDAHAVPKEQDPSRNTELKLKIMKLDEKRKELRRRELETLISKWKEEWERRRRPKANWYVF